MADKNQKIPFLDRNRLSIQAVQLAAAALVGILIYLYSRLISTLQGLFLDHFHQNPYFLALAMPLFFLAAAWVVVRFAPDARASGIPQVLAAIHRTLPDQPEALAAPLVSLKTTGVKILSLALGAVGGASVGWGGPTLQIGASLFAFTAQKTRRYFPLMDFRSFLVAGAAAGVSVAFNTPLAGITFALEEIAESTFVQFKRGVILSVIVASLTAQALRGGAAYFGHPDLSGLSLSFPFLFFALLIGAAGGLGGGLFARVLTHPLAGFPPRRWWARALACGAACAALALLTHGDSAGSGYRITRNFLNDPLGSLPPFFFLEKFLATVFSIFSGMAGGVFTPGLCAGAGLGYSLGGLFHAGDLRACALMGMAGFFAGSFQTPLTAVVIVMEMTGQSALLVPLLIAAFVAQGLGKWLMPVPLYRLLARRELEGLETTEA